jgi:membrane protease YdiL (CAAX protease family)
LRTSKNPSFILAILAGVLFVLLFARRGYGPLDFWWWIGANVALLVSLSFVLDRSYFSFVMADFHSRRMKKILLGVISAVALYFIFYAGSYISRALFPFASSGISDVYSFRGNASPLRVVLLLVFVIGPGEEVFWRGFIQRQWQDRFGRLSGCLFATALYSVVHLGSGNAMLTLAACVCGLFWGGLYLRYRSPLLNIVSHTLWAMLIFVVFPLGNLQ